MECYILLKSNENTFLLTSRTANLIYNSSVRKLNDIPIRKKVFISSICYFDKVYTNIRFKFELNDKCNVIGFINIYDNHWCGFYANIRSGTLIFIDPLGNEKKRADNFLKKWMYVSN